MLPYQNNSSPMQILGYVSRVKDVESQVDEDAVTSEQIEANAVRCPDTDAAEQMYKGVFIKFTVCIQATQQQLLLLRLFLSS